jgi:hypothetical protein
MQTLRYVAENFGMRKVYLSINKKWYEKVKKIELSHHSHIKKISQKQSFSIKINQK